jgi:plastocyanin
MAVLCIIGILTSLSFYGTITLATPSLAFTPSLNSTSSILGTTASQDTGAIVPHVKGMHEVNANISLGSSFPDNQIFFAPSKLMIGASTTVIWTNNDKVIHTVTSGNPYSGPSKQFESAYLNPGQKYNYTFTEVGDFDYYCTLHPFMRGEIVVANQSEPTVTVVLSEDLPKKVDIIIAKGSSFPDGGNFFVPSEVNIARNGTVQWINKDNIVHTIKSNNSLLAEPVEFNSGIIESEGSFTHTFRQKGIYDYYSELHPYMKGKVIVGFNLYNLQINNHTYAIPYLVTGRGNLLEEITLSSINPVLEIKTRVASPGNMTIVIPRDLLNIKGEFRDNQFAVSGDKPITYYTISNTPYSSTFAVQLGTGVNYLKIGSPDVLNQAIKYETPKPISSNATIQSNVDLKIPRGASERGHVPFDPPLLNLKTGDKLTVINDDLVPHTVTSGMSPQDSNSGVLFDTSLIQAGNIIDLSTSRLTPGQYDYFCIVHPFMKGKIQVLANNSTLFTQPTKTMQVPKTVKPTTQPPTPINPSPLNLPQTKQPADQLSTGSATITPIPSNKSRPIIGPQTGFSSFISIVKGSSDPAVGQFYDPSTATIQPRTTVTWTNKDDTLHTVTSGRPGGTSGKDFDSGYLGAGSLFQHTFDTPGTFDYWCTLHPHMSGQVVVR